MSKKSIFSIYGGYNLPYFAIVLIDSAIKGILVWLSAQIMQNLVDDIIEREIGSYLPQYLGMLCLLCCLGLAEYLLQYGKSIFMYKRQYENMQNIFHHIWKQPYESQRGTRDSEIYSACYSDLQLASDFYTQLDQLFAQIAVSAGAIVYIYGTNVVIGLSLTALGCVLILYRLLVSPRLGKYQREIQDYNALLNDVLIQRYESREYSSFFRFSCLKNKWKDLYRAYLDSNLEQCKWQVITSVFEYGIGFLQTYLPLFLVGVLFHEFTIGMMLALITNITAFMSIFRVMGRGIGELKKCRAGFERIEPYFGRETEESQKEKIDVDKLEWKVTQLSYAYGKKVGLHLQNLEYSGEKNLFLIGEKGLENRRLPK